MSRLGAARPGELELTGGPFGLGLAGERTPPGEEGRGNAGEAGGDAEAADEAVQDTPVEETKAEDPVVHTGPRKINMPEAEAVDLLDAAGASVFKRVLPVAAVAALLLILRRMFRKG